MRPLFSIVVNCRNGERFLRQALDSIYAQSFSSWEIVFYDNGSTDSSVEIAKSYDSKLRVFEADYPTNLGEARVKAVNLCVGRYLCFLDVDDVFRPDKLQIQFNIFSSTDAILISGGIAVIDELGQHLKTTVPKKSSPDLFISLLWDYQIFMPTVAIDLEFLRANELNFDSTMTFCPDYKLFMTITQMARIVIIDDVLCEYRVHGDSLSRETRNRTAGEEALSSVAYLRELVGPNGVSKEASLAFKHAEVRAKFWIALDALEQGLRFEALKLLLGGPVIPWRSIQVAVVCVLPFPTKWLIRVLYFRRL